MLDKIIYSNGFNAIVKGKYGYVVYNRNDMYIGKAIETYGEFSESEVELFRELCGEGDIIFDIGANIGTHTMVFSQLAGSEGRVHAFEPQRIVYQTLCANMAINSISNVECHQVALSTKEGFLFVPDVRYDKEGNFGGIEITKAKEGTRIPAVKLDNFLNVPRLKLMKIDVEGMECDVLAGATRMIHQHRPIIYLENDRVEKSKELIEFVWSLKYRAYWHFAPLFNPNNFSECQENLFPNLYSINMLCVHKSSELDTSRFREVTDSDYHPFQR